MTLKVVKRLFTIFTSVEGFAGGTAKLG